MTAGSPKSPNNVKLLTSAIYVTSYMSVACQIKRLRWLLIFVTLYLNPVVLKREPLGSLRENFKLLGGNLFQGGIGEEKL